MSEVVLGSVVLLVDLAMILESRRDATVSMPTAVGQGAEPESIEGLVIAGRKIEAIKLLRRESGLGLKEAKDQIDDLFRRLQPR